jgi:hypothetical protein
MGNTGSLICGDQRPVFFCIVSEYIFASKKRFLMSKLFYSSWAKGHHYSFYMVYMDRPIIGFQLPGRLQTSLQFTFPMPGTTGNRPMKQPIVLMTCIGPGRINERYANLPG